MEFTHSLGGDLLVPEDAAFPCGLVAKSFFNDTFGLYDQYPDETDLGKGLISINENNIAWESDVEHKFFNIDNEQQKEKL